MHVTLKDVLEVLVFGLGFDSVAATGTWWDRKHRKPRAASKRP
jgi:hypothetical protein